MSGSRLSAPGRFGAAYGEDGIALQSDRTKVARDRNNTKPRSRYSYVGHGSLEGIPATRYEGACTSRCATNKSQLQGTRELARRDVQLITTVREAYGESNTCRLLALCQVGDTKDLPVVYNTWAGKQKNNCIRHILQDHLDSCATVLDCKAPFVTTAA